jgi:phosphoheptose isomerase
MADDPRLGVIDRVFADAIRVHESVRRGSMKAVLAVVDVIVGSFSQGGKVMICGNGGSAADAQHFAAELVGRFERERRALAVVALTSDSSVLIANDYRYDRVFARQVEALGASRDVLVGISTSGSSRSVMEAFAAASVRGVRTIAFTGRDGGPLGRTADIHVNVPETSTARVQEVHRTLMHAICGLIEAGL